MAQGRLQLRPVTFMVGLREVIQYAGSGRFKAFQFTLSLYLLWSWLREPPLLPLECRFNLRFHRFTFPASRHLSSMAQNEGFR
jgi:hypothetical protein